MSFPKQWKSKSLPDLIRLGSRNDGGYVLPKRVIGASDVLISCGICDDWRFEREFLQRNPASRLIAFDPSLTSTFWLKRILSHLFSATFRLRLGQLPRVFDWLRCKRFFSDPRRVLHRRKVGYREAGDATVDSILGEVAGDRIFIKIDIEGWEYRILSQVVANQHRWTGVAIEFHDVDLMRDRIAGFLDEISSRFVIAWIHGNNCAGVDASNDPIALELVLMSKALCTEEELSGCGAAAVEDLNAPNDPARPDLVLTYSA